MSLIYNIFRQCFFIPSPTLTPHNLPDQTGRVFIVTGGYAGCGKELVKILYQRNGTIYVAGRSQDKAKAAIDEITSATPKSDGRLEFLQLDLADLPSVKKSAEDFLKREQRLDVLTNNAGVMMPPSGTKTAQNYELQMGTNCLGHFLFTELLTPLLLKTAAISPPGSVRVTWAASLAIFGSPKTGFSMDPATGNPKVFSITGRNYGQSKACNVLLAQYFSSRHNNDNNNNNNNNPSAAGDNASKSNPICSVAWNPGNLRSELQRHLSGLEGLMAHLICYPVHFGGLTELWAGWSDEAGLPENQGKLVGPWGRFVMLRSDLEEEKNAAAVKRFGEWCRKETESYLE